MTPEETEKEIKVGLRAVLFAAAARYDAEGDPEKLARLRATVDSPGSILYRETGNTEVMLAEIGEAMGPDWQPSGEWASKLESLRTS